MTEFRFDPFSDSQREDPYPAYAELRRHSPVAKTEALGGAYVVARYDDVTHVLRHPELFSSRAMQTALGGTVVANASPPSPAESARLAEVIAAMPVSVPEWMATRYFQPQAALPAISIGPEKRSPSSIMVMV